MAQSRVEIVNRALTLLASARIMDLADGAKSARTMNAVYAGERDSALASANWLFAKQYFRPAQSSDVPLHTFRYQYVIPEPCLRLIEIRDIFVGGPSLGPRYIGESEKLFERVSDRIYTNFGAPLNCSGVFRVEDEGKFDPLFIDYFITKLAIAGYNELTRKGASGEATLMEKQKKALTMAKRMNAIQEPPEEIPDDSWIMSRIGP